MLSEVKNLKSRLIILLRVKSTDKDKNSFWIATRWKHHKNSVRLTKKLFDLEVSFYLNIKKEKCWINNIFILCKPLKMLMPFIVDQLMISADWFQQNVASSHDTC